MKISNPVYIEKLAPGLLHSVFSEDFPPAVAREGTPVSYNAKCGLHVRTSGGPSRYETWNGDVAFLHGNNEQFLIGLHPERGNIAIRYKLYRESCQVYKLCINIKAFLLFLIPSRNQSLVSNEYSDLRNSRFRRGYSRWGYHWVSVSYPAADSTGHRDYSFSFGPYSFVLSCQGRVRTNSRS